MPLVFIFPFKLDNTVFWGKKPYQWQYVPIKYSSLSGGGAIPTVRENIRGRTCAPSNQLMINSSGSSMHVPLSALWLKMLIILCLVYNYYGVVGKLTANILGIVSILCIVDYPNGHTRSLVPNLGVRTPQGSRFQVVM